MSKPGPKKTPRGLARIRGERVRPEIQPTTASSPPPKWLSQAAKAEWRRLSPELVRLGLLTVLDVQPFAAYCQWYARWRRYEEKLARVKDELVTAKRSDYVQAHPLVSMVRSAVETMNRLAASFGLTPADRASLEMPLDPTAPTFRDAQPANKPMGPKPDEFDVWRKKRQRTVRRATKEPDGKS